MRHNQAIILAVALVAPVIVNAQVWDYIYQGIDWVPTGVCDASDRQSPIAFGLKRINEDSVVEKSLATAIKQPLHPLNFDLAPEKQEIAITPKIEGDVMGYTVQVEDSTVYELKQMHFHCPAEHTFEAAVHKHRPLEVHMVHTEVDGDLLLVVGITFEPVHGSFSPFLASVIDNLRGISRPLEVQDILPQDAPSDMLHYKGSLTTPPCAEQVEWYVRSAAVPAAEEQLEFFRALLVKKGTHGNYRAPMNIVPFPGNLNSQVVYRTSLFAADIDSLLSGLTNARPGFVDPAPVSPPTIPRQQQFGHFPHGHGHGHGQGHRYGPPQPYGMIGGSYAPMKAQPQPHHHNPPPKYPPHGHGHGPVYQPRKPPHGYHH